MSTLAERPLNDEYEITMDKSKIKWPNEVIFADFLESQDKEWVYEPIRLKTGNIIEIGKKAKRKRKETYRPDFYCPQDEEYYEVSSTLSAYHASKSKIVDVMNNNIINITAVWPDGRIIKKFERNVNLINMTNKDITKYYNCSIEVAEKLYIQYSVLMKEFPSGKRIYGIDIDRNYAEIIKSINNDVCEDKHKKLILREKGRRERNQYNPYWHLECRIILGQNPKSHQRRMHLLKDLEKFYPKYISAREIEIFDRSNLTQDILALVKLGQLEKIETYNSSPMYRTTSSNVRIVE